MNLSTLLGITSLGGDLLKARMMRRLMKDIAGVIALAVATGFMAGALLIGCFYVAYQELVFSGGLDPLAATIFLMIMGLMVTYALLRMTKRKLRVLKQLRGQGFTDKADLADRMYGLADSFLDGFGEAYRSSQTRRY